MFMKYFFFDNKGGKTTAIESIRRFEIKNEQIFKHLLFTGDCQ